MTKRIRNPIDEQVEALVKDVDYSAAEHIRQQREDAEKYLRQAIKDDLTKIGELVDITGRKAQLAEDFYDSLYNKDAYIDRLEQRCRAHEAEIRRLKHDLLWLRWCGAALLVAGIVCLWRVN